MEWSQRQGWAMGEKRPTEGTLPAIAKIPIGGEIVKKECPLVQPPRKISTRRLR